MNFCVFFIQSHTSIAIESKLGLTDFIPIQIPCIEILNQPCVTEDNIQVQFEPVQIQSEPFRLDFHYTAIPLKLRTDEQFFIDKFPSQVHLLACVYDEHAFSLTSFICSCVRQKLTIFSLTSFTYEPALYNA